MRYLIAALLYAALGLLANPAAADVAAAMQARAGDMKKLAFHDPTPVGTASFVDADGRRHRLSDYRGKVLLVNFWATWCPPCRKEMPMLDALQKSLGGKDFEVLTIATGRNPPAAVARFFREAGVENLPTLLDPRSELARQMAVFGLPLSVVVDRQGREIARLRGDADWSSPSALAVLRALIGEQGPRP